MFCCTSRNDAEKLCDDSTTCSFSIDVTPLPLVMTSHPQLSVAVRLRRRRCGFRSISLSDPTSTYRTATCTAAAAATPLNVPSCRNSEIKERGASYRQTVPKSTRPTAVLGNCRRRQWPLFPFRVSFFNGGGSGDGDGGTSRAVLSASRVCLDSAPPSVAPSRAASLRLPATSPSVSPSVAAFIPSFVPSLRRRLLAR